MGECVSESDECQTDNYSVDVSDFYFGGILIWASHRLL